MSGGWDTHVNEGGASGALASNLNSLGKGLVTFAESLGEEWNNTVVFVLSEFGRTFRENGNAWYRSWAWQRVLGAGRRHQRRPYRRRTGARGA